MAAVDNPVLLSRPRKQGPADRKKVKSGCRTCKVRKVKCDEFRPACKRCSSTGRVCDGYGVWADRAVVGISPDQHSPCPAAGGFGIVLSSTSDEKKCLHWFKHRTSLKFPGAFRSPFWDTLVLQATSTEPAVLHAVVALSSIHKQGPAVGIIPPPEGSLPNASEQFTLSQYSQAIRNLQPFLSRRDAGSVRVALIACMMFTCMEFLAGHMKSGNNHLKHGMKVLEAIEYKAAGAGDSHQSADPYLDSPDAWILEVYTTVNIQAVLFGQGHLPQHMAPRSEGNNSMPMIFKSMNQARRFLDRLLCEVLYLSERDGRGVRQGHSPQWSLERQQMAQTSLKSWIATYRASRVSLQAESGPLGEVAYQVLLAYHVMATIMAETCLRGYNESVFDSLASEFASVVNHSIRLHSIAQSLESSEMAAVHAADMPHFMADVGWIPPLYYAATKCRIPRVRRQAIRLLASRESKESIWSSQVAASVASEVVRIEEVGFYGTIGEDDTPLFDEIGEHDLEVPVLPESQRIHDIRVILSDRCLDGTILVCTKFRHESGCEVIAREYAGTSGSWINTRSSI